MNTNIEANMSDNRQPRARLDILVNHSDELSEKLMHLLEFPIEIEDTEDDIKTFVHELRQAQCDYNTAARATIAALQNHGCTQETLKLQAEIEERNHRSEGVLEKCDSLLRAFNGNQSVAAIMNNGDSSLLQQNSDALASQIVGVEGNNNNVGSGLLHNSLGALNLSSNSSVSSNVNDVQTTDSYSVLADTAVVSSLGTKPKYSVSKMSGGSHTGFASQFNGQLTTSQFSMTNSNLVKNNEPCCLYSTKNSNAFPSPNHYCTNSNMFSMPTISSNSRNEFHTQSNEQFTSQFSIPNNQFAKRNETYLCSRSDSNAFEPTGSFCTNTAEPSLPFKANTDYLTFASTSRTVSDNLQPFSVPSNINGCNDSRQVHFHNSSNNSYYPTMSVNSHANNFSHPNYNVSSHYARNCSNRPETKPIIPQDPASLHLIKQQLFNKVSQPFAGDPQEFDSWMLALNNRSAGIPLSPFDKLQVLEANTTGEPQKIVKKYMILCARDPSTGLSRCLCALKKKFGSNILVANSLNARLESFQQIKSAHHSKRLTELLDLCEHIELSMPSCNELSIYNTSLGIRKIWLKLPESLQNSWRSVCDNYRMHNFDSHPSFGVFVEFLTQKTREYDDPSYQYQFLANESKRSYSSRSSYKTEDLSLVKTDKPAVQHESKSNVSNVKDADKCCLHENGTHILKDCRFFQKMIHRDKISTLKKFGLCFLCFGKHVQSACNSNYNCEKCNGKHATLLHFDSKKKPAYNEHNDNHSRKNDINPESNLCTKICGSKFLFKDCSKTLLVDISSPHKPGKNLRCYAILDEQSSSTFVDPKVAEFFNYTGPIQDYSLRTLTGSCTSTQGIRIKGLQIKGANERKRLSLPPVLTNEFIPSSKQEIATRDVVLSHPNISRYAKYFNDFSEDAEVLILIGRDAGECLSTKCYGHKPPYVHHTPLGWALVGRSCVSEDNNQCCLKTNNADHFSALSCFKQELKWNLPELDVFTERQDDELPGLSKNDEKFLSTVFEGIHTNDAGNIVLPLPFKDENVQLPNNQAEVYHRTKNTLARLKKDTEKLTASVTTMQKYIDAGHVEEVPMEEYSPKRPQKSWWIPIFPVTHPKKGKVRLVFDSSARYQNTSLNDQILSGPDINNNLRDVLIGFRNGPIGFSADIEMMFHNFYIKPEEKDFTRFYWFSQNKPDSNICQYRARVHIFGNTSSPALANLGIRYAVSNLPAAMSHVEQFVGEQFYVDDAFGCASSVTTATKILKDTITVLKGYNIRLHKLCSSSKEVLQSFPSSEIAENTRTIDFAENSQQSALGMAWNTDTDTLTINCNILDRPFTRRGILATVNSIFDPLGIISPILLEGRLLQRELLNSTAEGSAVDWDIELSDDHKAAWDIWKSSLTKLNGISIPRSYTAIDFDIQKVKLHAFCDASVHGTGYAIYIQHIDYAERHHVSFVVGNSKIAPKKPPSIPRLELCSALQVSIAASKVAEKLKIPTTNVYLYSDSMIVLGYLNNQDKRFSRYVSRRVKLILKSFPSSQWQYVSTTTNPADIATRKQTVSTLVNSNWFKGPEFLWTGNFSNQYKEPEQLPELDTRIQTFTTNQVPSYFNDIVERSSSLKKATGVMSIVLTFKSKLLDIARKNLGVHIVERAPTTSSAALEFLIKDVQREHFSDLFNNSKTCHSHRLSNLSPFVDERGILRVGGRLSRSNLDYSNKYPILLPNDSKFTILVIQYYHERTKHQGRVITLSAIREAGYYIYRASSTIKKFLRDCVTCRKLRLPLGEQRMSDLPSDRLQCSPPFSYTGVDVYGPYEVSDGIVTRRTQSKKKCWAVLFTCMNSRATHIEPLPTLDINSMKNALRRFFCLRGPCFKFRSDRGTNFVGANNQQIEFSMSDLEHELKENNCEWEFNPPKASHFGGIWERQIKTVKSILNTSLHQLGHHTLTRDDFYTYLQECAAIINNTPLWEYSSDPNDPRPLTPKMLLTLKEDPPTSDVYTHRDLLAYGSKRWRRIQYLSDQFWSQWRTNYLQTLQPRKKWLNEKRSLQPGDVVLVKNDKVKRYQWPLARVISTKKSQDGLVRSANIAVAPRNSSSCKQLCRPVTELSLLIPANSSNSE